MWLTSSLPSSSLLHARRYCKTNHHLSAAKLSDALVKEATKNRGSGDNTTVVAIRVQYAPK